MASEDNCEEGLRKLRRELLHDIHQLRENGDVLADRLFNLEAGSCSAAPRTKIAFYARTPVSSPVTVTPGSIIKFPEVLSNYGDGYDVETGTFTCPVSGLYHFSVHLQRTAPNNYYSWFRLEMNSTDVMNLVLWPSSDYYVADGGSAYIHCPKGHVMHVKVHSSQGNLDLDDGFTWFSGALVSEDSEEQ